jgi:hypothetical protein
VRRAAREISILWKNLSEKFPCYGKNFLKISMLWKFSAREVSRQTQKMPAQARDLKRLDFSTHP